ncbi:hypothetical protein QBC47DRAFT_380224 [Echria macrotheca]|uniref:Uncharacterized protein n=1 Tax=Echria macrotheca TaxID=438768 RepID=A0AAJ0BEM7_9PEZI|nr:hypothetical protein QBC47DRAFT_380224 [Echria macrotheca]
MSTTNHMRLSRQPTRSNTSSAPTAVSSSIGRQCLVSGCRAKQCHARFGDDKIYSKYCYDHTCSRTVPVEDGYHCPMPKEEADEYCHNHMTCGADNCREVGFYPDGTFPWYCSQHRCTKPNCLSGTADLLNRRCETHQECAALQCTSPPDRAQNSNFCKPHTCTQARGTCSLQAVANNRCAEHTICEVSSCTRPCHVVDNGRRIRIESLCTEHLALKCARPGCGGRKLHAHRRYCLDHGCRLPDCAGERHAGGGTLCDVHKCTFDACFECIARPDDERSLFCRAHACRVDGCLYSRRYPGGGCERHTCEVQGCSKVVAGESRRCETHGTRAGRCRVEGCGREAGLRGYCKASHACVVDGCQRARLSLSPGADEEDDDLTKCLKHDREERIRRVSKERDEWRTKYEALVAEKPGDKSAENKRKWRKATVEDSEDTGDW